VWISFTDVVPEATAVATAALDESRNTRIADDVTAALTRAQPSDRRASAPAAAYPDLLAISLRAPRAVVCLLSAAVLDLMRMRHKLGESVAHVAMRRYLARRDARVADLVTG
jgi:hypothetical protein